MSHNELGSLKNTLSILGILPFNRKASVTPTESPVSNGTTLYEYSHAVFDSRHNVDSEDDCRRRYIQAIEANGSRNSNSYNSDEQTVDHSDDQTDPKQRLINAIEANYKR